MKSKHLVSLADYSKEEIKEILELSKDVKKNREKYFDKLRAKTLAMIFEKPSTRTRVSFDVGIYELGGHPLYLGMNDIQIKRGETISDTAQVLSRYCHGIMLRTFAHKTIEEFAEYSSVPVINGLSDYLHPCQALADYFTIWEHKGRLKGLKIAYLGDGNNVAHSLINGAVKLGVNISLGCPKGYQPDEKLVSAAREIAKKEGVTVEITEDPDKAVAGADALYTDVWASMGQESERAKRLNDLKDYQLDLRRFKLAKPDAIFLHCLPAHRGEEVAAEVADHERSVIFDEAENRLHTQKAVMLLLMGDR
ncbi:MAG: ornithine carbamoyltransferase [Myxococcota bacterium]